MAGSFFPGFMNSDRLHKVCNPPGGSTNDIFDIEKRQKQRNLIVYEEKEVKKDKTIASVLLGVNSNSHLLPNSSAEKIATDIEEHNTPSATKGTADRTHKKHWARQATSHKSEKLDLCAVGIGKTTHLPENKEDPRKSLETEDIFNPLENANRKLRRSLSDCNIKQPAGRTPPLAVGKENFGTHFKGSLSPRIITMTESEGKVIDESEGEDDELLISEKPKRNPITGEGMEDVPPIKLEDTTNADKQDDAAAKQDSEGLEQKKPRRPCIRVRQPPGGTSSIIF